MTSAGRELRCRAALVAALAAAAAVGIAAVCSPGGVAATPQVIQLRPIHIGNGRVVFHVEPLLQSRIHTATFTDGRDRKEFDCWKLSQLADEGRIGLAVPSSWRRGHRPWKHYALVIRFATAPQNETETPRAKAATRPPGSVPMCDGDAASHVSLSPWEPRPGNAAANAYVPGAGELSAYRSFSKKPYKAYVTGRSTLAAPTTDELLQWAAWKWGVDADLLRAVAAQESHWDQQSQRGDLVTVSAEEFSHHPPQAQVPPSDVYSSLGLTQVKWRWPEGSGGWAGTEPLRWKSTAFNLDVWGQQFRSCFDGKEEWLRSNGFPKYSPGDEWGCVGKWFSGGWWDSDAVEYVDSVKNILVNKTWQRY
jgi:autotransporter family porin